MARRQDNRQARYWIGTVNPEHGEWEPPLQLPVGVVWLRGQRERGAQGTLHWQLFAAFDKKTRMGGVKAKICNGHWEPSRSEAAEEYVWKEETRVDGSQFELGAKKLNRNSPEYWEGVWDKAKKGKILEIDPDVRVKSYRTIKQIEKDHMKPCAMDRNIYVVWGPTRTGKSHLSWEAATLDAYPKSSTSIYWDGYQGQENVVMDEFRGKIGIEHILTWCDKYPVAVQNKFGGCVLNAKNIWITSNIHPNDWYPDLDQETKDALVRRMKIFHITSQDEEINFI